MLLLSGTRETRPTASLIRQADETGAVPGCSDNRRWMEGVASCTTELCVQTARL